MEQLKPDLEDQMEILEAACEREAKRMLQFFPGGPVVGEQEGDDPLTADSR